jgi:hypothetical protein
LFQAFALAFARVSLAVGRVGQGLFITTAPSGAKATGTVEFFRTLTTAGAVTVKAGTRVTTSSGGREFVTTADAVFGALDLGPLSVSVEAIATGYAWNVTGQRITPDGEVLPGDIDTISYPVQDPPFGDATIQVRQIVDTSGGVAALLDQLGADRGLARSSGEGDDAYRARVRSLVDSVSPDAIIRALTNLLLPMSVAYTFIETWSPSYQGCWFDGSEDVGSIPTLWGFNPDLFCFDDPRPTPPFCNRWLDDLDTSGAFIVTLPDMPSFVDVGMAWDDTATTPADHATAYGRRSHAAWDVSDAVDPLLILSGGFDGFDLGKQQFYLDVWDLLQRIKAAGIYASLELDGE